MMMYGDKYEYFWADKGGFDWADYNLNVLGEVQSGTGANQVKHYGRQQQRPRTWSGLWYGQYGNRISTHLIRLSDVYLIYARAVLGNQGSSSDAKA